MSAQPSRIASLLPAGRLARVVLAISLVAGSAARLWDVGPALLFGDELHSLALLAGGYEEVLTHFGAKGSGLALPLLQRILFDLFGSGHWTIRAPAWVPSLLLLFAVWPLGRRMLGEPAALVATALVAVSPSLVFYARFARIYSLVALLSLLLLQLAYREIEGDARDRARLVGLAIVTALLPWAHPTALGVVLPIYAGSLAGALLARDRSAAWRRRVALRLAAALGAGGLLCLIVYLPGWTSLWRFVASRTGGLQYYGEFGPLDVAALLFGGRAAALVMLLLAAGAAGALWRRRGALSLPLLSACVGPPMVIALVRPYGDAYAYARYVLPCVVPVALLVGFGLAEAARALRDDERGAAGALLAGAALALALASVGPPLWPTGPLRQQANTYLDLLPLPAFDAIWPETPAFYRDLAARPESERRALRLVELPALTTRTRHLYRHYQRLHGGVIWLAPLAGELPLIPDGPYVALQSRDWVERSAPDYVVVHLDIASEIARYWRFVFDRAAVQSGRDDLAAYMARQSRYGGPLPEVPPGLVQGLTRLFGEPVYRDDVIAVWSTRAAAPPGDAE